MLTYSRATLETRLIVSEITARIQNRTFEADPNKWWWRHNVGNTRWIGWVTYEKFMVRRPYSTEGIIDLRLGGFYREVGFEGVISDKGNAREIAFAAVLRPRAVVSHSLFIVFWMAACLMGIIFGGRQGGLAVMLILGVIAFLAQYTWWGYKACAREELRYLGEMLDATLEEKPSNRR